MLRLGTVHTESDPQPRSESGVTPRILAITNEDPGWPEADKQHADQGYQAEGETFLEAEIPHVRMTKPL